MLSNEGLVTQKFDRLKFMKIWMEIIFAYSHTITTQQGFCIISFEVYLKKLLVLVC